MNVEVIANLHGLQKGTDMYPIVQYLLNNSSVWKFRVLEGDYILSQRLVIPAEKELILTGNNNSFYLEDNEVSNLLFTKLDRHLVVVFVLS